MKNKIPIIFDQNLPLKNLLRALEDSEKYLHSGYLYSHCANELLDRIKTSQNTGDLNTIIEISIRNPALFDIISSELKPINYLGTTSHANIKTLFADKNIKLNVEDDIEIISLPQSNADLALNNLTFSLVNDLPGIFSQTYKALKSGGLLKGVILGSESLYELRQSFYAAEGELKQGLSPKIAPFPTVRDIGNLLMRANYRQIITDRDILNITYKNIYDLLLDIKTQGLSNPLVKRAKTFATKSLIDKALGHYNKNYKSKNTNEGVNVTIELIYYSAIK